MKLTELTTYQTTVTQARAHRALKTKTSYFLREHNITMMQWAIIGSLYTAGDAGMRVSDVAAQLDTSLAFVTTTLNVLEAKNIVSRASHAQDNRAKIVRLTPEFAPKVQAIEKELATKLCGWLIPAIGREDLATYITVLGKIAEATA
jgi:DNA-binding MarR family transcriptional regulator